MTRSSSYLMESLDEAIRIVLKTDPEALRKQAMWCGLRPGLRVLDVGCGPGKISSILHKMVQPGGELVGLDFSEQRIEYAGEHYGQKSGIEFQARQFFLLTQIGI